MNGPFIAASVDTSRVREGAVGGWARCACGGVGEWAVHRRLGGHLVSARRGMSWRRECACGDRVRCPFALMWVGRSSGPAALALSRSGERRVSRGGEWAVHRRVVGHLVTTRTGMSWRRECACRDCVRCPFTLMWVGRSLEPASLALSRSGERRISRCDEWAVHAIASESPPITVRDARPRWRERAFHRHERPFHREAALPRLAGRATRFAKLPRFARHYPLREATAFREALPRFALPRLAGRYPLPEAPAHPRTPRTRAPAHPRKHHHQPGGQRIGCGTYFEASGNRSSTSSTRATTAAT